MAHYDSAPVSLLYLPAMVKNFRSSLFVNFFLIVAAFWVSILGALHMGGPLISWARWILALYFLVQGVLTAFDHVRYGYTNGASDNATGTAAAMVTAMRLWENPVPGLGVSVVLTGAEETGSLTTLVHANKLVDAAILTAEEEIRFHCIKTATWHTGDFDTIWFARAGIPCLTLTAQDKNAAIPHLHRPEDVIENLDPLLTQLAVDFAERVIRRLPNQAENAQINAISPPADPGQSAIQSH